MLVQKLKMVSLLISFVCIGFWASAQKVAQSANTDPNWSKPYPPFQIAGNLYYVGTFDLACYLIVTPQGNILINTGLADSAPIIKANIEDLGFSFADIKILLTTQAHFDHMGAMAAIKKMTGAKMMIDAGDAGVMADGGRSDYALGGKESVIT
jgi:metallo-beta-lactamase class B